MNKMRTTLVLFFLGVSPVFAATTNWTGLGGDSFFNTVGNWNNGVPGVADIAGFNAAAPTSISINALTQLDRFTFNPGASAYTFTVSGLQLAFLGSGVINNSSNAQTLVNNNSIINFNNNADAGNVTMVNPVGSIDFFNSATAGSAVITNTGGSVQFLNTTSGVHATFINTGSGLLSFENNSTASSATITNAATLQFINNAVAGNAVITNNAGSIHFANLADGGNASITNNSGGTLQITDNATLGNATLVNNGSVNIAGLIAASCSAGSISGSGTVALGSKNLTVGSNNLSTTVSGIVSGTDGSLTKVGNGTLTLSGANSYTGATAVNGGTLNILGSLTSDVTIGAAGNLAGTGSLENITNSGTVTPGTIGTGTLTAARYSGAGTFSAGFDGSTHGALHVTGNANISGGTLSLTGSNFAVGQYSVLDANSLTGTFSTLNSPASSILTFAPEYTATDALVRIDFATPFLPFAQTTNQRSVATNLNGAKTTSTAEFTNAIGSLSLLPAAQIPGAYNQISGDSLASFQEVGLQNAAFFTQGMRQHSIILSSGTAGLWAQAVHFTDNRKGDISLGSPSSYAGTSGFQVGDDLVIVEGLLVGLSAGYSETNLDVTDRGSSGSTKSILSGIYAHYIRGPWFANGSLSLTSESNTMTRSIRYGALAENADADFNSRVYTTFLESGYSYYPAKNLLVEPSVSLRQNHLSQDGFTESGAAGLDLTAADHTLNSWVSSLGAGLTRTFLQQSLHPLAIRGSLAWEHEWADPSDALSVHFADTSGGSDFTVEGTPRSRDAAAIGLEGRVPLREGLELFGTYTAKLASAQTSQSLFGGARLRW